MNDTEPRDATLGDTFRAALRPIASLQLTVALFALSLVLVFFGTLAQKNAGIWMVVDQYFWSVVVMIDPQLCYQFAQIFFGLPTTVNWPGWFQIPFPGGKLLGGLMFANLIAAHTVRFKLSWRRAGIFILHGGILLMFVGEFITRTYTVEQQMTIAEGGDASFTIDTRNYELAIIDASGAVNDRVVAVPASTLRGGGAIALPELPFDLAARAYYRNAEVYDADKPEAAKAVKEHRATEGFGKDVVAIEVPTVSGVDSDKKSDMPAVVVELQRKDGKPLGTWLVPWGYKPQTIEVDGRSLQLTFRNSHYYKPYSLHLNDFKFDKYLGTEKAKNYSSEVILNDPERGVESTVVISMNSPMRYRGETFYQQSFSPDETSTVLTVVDNPGWIIPYASCAIVTLGLLLHFGLHMREYLRKMLRKRQEAIEQTTLQRWLPWGVLLLSALMIGVAATPHGKLGRKGLDLERIAMLPVVDGGRVKPLDTVARVDLRQVNHTEFYNSPDERTKRPAIDWWVSTAATDEPATSPSFKAEVFRIESDQVLNLLGLPRRDGLRYSAGEIAKKYQELRQAVMKAKMKPEKTRDLFDAKVLELWTKLGTHNAILVGDGTLAIPPLDGQPWRTIAAARDAAQNRAFNKFSELSKVPVRGPGDIGAILKSLPQEEARKLIETIETMEIAARNEDAGLKPWEDLFAAYRSGNAERFNEALRELEKNTELGVSPGDRGRVQFEGMLNDTAFYFWCTGLYVLALLLTAAAWSCYGFNPGLGQAWRKSAFLVLAFAFALHTFTLLSRMYLMDRPFVFVTNLYSTAVFIGWAAVGISLLVELAIPVTLGCVVASVLGFLTTVLAHNLAASGDTLEMMQAVLDTNFWLATHVTTINLGYAATYIAGLIGILYLILGIFTPYLKQSITVNGVNTEIGRLVGQILYGAIAGATVLSFVGTVLGGIWGDQSWGRFWGWDPKENGALMIVIWNVMILHARWAGLVKDRGIAVLALGGNMITTWSYFGTNQLGVGLHAYGFSNTLAMVCVVMWMVNLAIVGVGLVPTRFWRSYQVKV